MLWSCSVVGLRHLVRQVHLPGCRLLSENQELAAFLWVHFWVVWCGVPGLKDLEDAVEVLTGQVDFPDEVVDVQPGG